MQHTFAINALNLPSSCAQAFDHYKDLEQELDDTLKDQAKLEENLEKFVVIAEAVDSEQAYLFVTAGIGKYAKHTCDSWNCNFVTAGIGILLQLTYLCDI